MSLKLSVLFLFILKIKSATLETVNKDTYSIPEKQFHQYIRQ